MVTENMSKIFSQFNVKGNPTVFKPYGNGHINSTFLVTCEDDGEKKYYILQTVNSFVFNEPKRVIFNIENITSFLSNKTDNPRRVMHLIPTKSGKNFFEDSEGRVWRVYDFIEDSLCLEKPETTEDFYQTAVAFGRFQRDLDDFPADKLFETIKDFHNTPKRYNAFLNAVDMDICDRAKDVKPEIEFVNTRKDFCSVLYDANKANVLPLRVTHNDTKINNVLLDKDTRKALCVIDLDTVMPGFSVTDFGDAIRFGANTAAEDEPDVSKVSIDLELFEAFASGYLKGCGGKLSEEEIMLMPEGAKMMTLECGMRFLTDYLQGDTYFKIAYPEHNLVRCRTQFKLVEDMEKHWQEMKDIVKKYI